MKIAVIDLGSNSVRMTVFLCENGNITELCNERKFVRLSEGLSEDNLLKAEPMNRTAAALSEFRRIIDDLKCDKVCAVATEALRRAENAAEFLCRIKAECGIEIKILSGEEESRADFYASREFISAPSLIMDVGGGSLEIIAADKNEMLAHICLPFGAVVMTDKLGRDSNALENFFADEFSRIEFLKGFLPKSVIALGGSVRALFAVNNMNVHGRRLDSASFLALSRQIFGMTDAELSKFPALADRADIITAGLAPFSALIKATGAGEIILNSHGVREGIVLQCSEEK